MELNKLYFYTATIVDWKALLRPKAFKNIIIDSLAYLSEKKKITVYGFVIMPNHIHLIWELLEPNGKETPVASFMKYTSHQFLTQIRDFQPDALRQFQVNREERSHHFWQKKSLSVELFSPKVIYQKLDYIHNNPCQGKWNLANDPVSYGFSSAKFYESGEDDFGFLTHIGERF